MEKAIFYYYPYGNRKRFLEIPPCLSKPLCVYVCTIIIHIMCEWHVGHVGDSLQLKTVQVGGVLTPFISEK